MAISLSVVCSTVLRSSTAAPVATVDIAFVGAWPKDEDPSYQSFRKALEKLEPSIGAELRLHYQEGSDLDAVRLQRAVKAAVAKRPAVVVVPTGDGAAVAASLRTEVPVVFASYLDPVRQGIVKSLRRPGGRITGVSLADYLHAKRLELLKDAFPGIVRVAVLADRSWASAYDAPAMLDAAAARLGLQIVLLLADTRDELDHLMAGQSPDSADAWYIPPTYIAYLAEADIIAYMRRMQRPAIHATEAEVASGALMAYSQDTRFVFDALSALTARIALGEDAGAIPIERPRRYVLSVRPREEPASLRIHPAVVLRADRVY